MSFAQFFLKKKLVEKIDARWNMLSTIQALMKKMCLTCTNKPEKRDFTRIHFSDNNQ